MKKNHIDSHQRGGDLTKGRKMEPASRSPLMNAVFILAGLLGKKVRESFQESLRRPVSPHDGRLKEAQNQSSEKPKTPHRMNTQETQNAQYKTASGRLAFRFALRKEWGSWRIYVTKQVSWFGGIKRRQIWASRKICSGTPFLRLKDAYHAAAAWAERTEALMSRRAY